MSEILSQQQAADGIIYPHPDADRFTVGGIAYVATQELTVARQRILQRFSVELAADTSISAIIDLVNSSWDHSNAGRIADGIHGIGKLRDALDMIGTNRLRDVEICALFFNAPGEDPGLYEHSAQQAKVAAWGGVAAGFFTRRAFALLTAPSTAYPPAPGPPPPAGTPPPAPTPTPAGP
ncbi:hypothetical protein [Hymenobacter lapidiphilus]|uniref:Uncharacterized protein n=1 Tax=Hymenobacter lapidiphilus TaxID=2608003 RepID=A0A7Y7U7W7_9BACT|nr:hypothetical protein [Hymenobacter lapidiphilus]NVO33209.1 hypothetical protein [Hymenobacter lapidiphilus]